ncbi:uncharacterized protein IL334_002727 [Kwoniella shivajii]|uniref:Cation efflux protein transmembrane domain-containing protein n=1 Tax=Kwoniella shivajii TaxID=564305 RepID=A0ABZ1CVK2_9TREE|nr:hypothetical protein IL334_002727 [Kwoniella shivajii]
MQQPSTPTPLHRTVHKVPSRRSLFLSSSPSSYSITQSSSNSYLRLFVGALAVAGSKTWVLDDPRHLGGGVGWLVSGLWAGRVIGEIKELFGDARKKSKNSATRTADNVQLSVALALQSVAFFSALQYIGPLRLIIVALLSSSIGATTLSDIKSLIPLIPLILSSVYITVETATVNVIALISLLVFAGSTFLPDQYLSNQHTSRMKNESKDKIRNDKGLWLCLISTTIASLSIFILYQMGIIPIPLPISNVPGQRFASFVTGLLVRYIPFPFTSTSSPGSVLRLKTVRDKILFLCTIPVLQFFALNPTPTTIDLFALLPLALLSINIMGERKTGGKSTVSSWSFPNKSLSTARSSWSFMSLLPARWRPHLQTILNTPQSSKIFYFLLLNLAYMFVQMIYGVATNSLGLLSDAIHMLFDCLGLAVGLWASVAATWKPDAKYTFGYNRVETLSGFANGCFLILISIFIIFEGIQRVLDPPEMEIKQLLLVSSVGLAINLWGMWATGGHHHHGHGHGHGHDHGNSHGHSHIPVNEKKEDHRHDDSHNHHRSVSQGTSASTRPVRTLAKRRSSGFLRSHVQQDTHVQHHTPTHGHNHHEHTDCNGHDHDHHDHHNHVHNDHDHDHSHPHPHQDHSHSHTHQSHDHDHDHSNDHDDHGHGNDHAHSHNMRGVFLHVMADTLGSVGVIISTILIKFTGWTGFDPIASLFIAILIMASVIPLVIDSGKVLCLDVGSHKEEEIRNALSELNTVEGVANYASPRFWPRCEGELIGSIHIQLSPSPSSFDPTRFSTPYLNRQQKSGDTIYVNSDKVIARVEKTLKKRIKGLTELIVQIEGSEEKGFCTCMTGR